MLEVPNNEILKNKLCLHAFRPKKQAAILVPTYEKGAKNGHHVICV